MAIMYSHLDNMIYKNYETMPFAVYLDLLRVVEQATDETERTTGVLSILTGRSETELLDLSINEYGRLTQSAAFIGEPPAPVPVRAEYQIGEFVLVPVLKPEQMTAAQYIDFQTYVKDETRTFELLACMLVPKGKKYGQGYDVADIVQTLRVGLMMRDGIALQSFFVASLAASIPGMLYCLGIHPERLTRLQRYKIRRATRRFRRSLKNGVGWLSLTQSRKLAASLGRPFSESL